MEEGAAAFQMLRARAIAWLRRILPWIRKRRKILGAAGGSMALVLAVCLALGPVVRGRAAAAAGRRGMHLEIGRVWPAFGGVTLRNVNFGATASDGSASPWLAGHFDRIEVKLGLGLGLRSIRVRGGSITLSGSLDEVTQHLKDLRKGQAAEPTRSAAGAGPDLLVEGLHMTWAGVLDGASSVEVDGVRVEERRSDSGATDGTLSIEAAGITCVGFAARARALTVRFDRADGKTTVHEARLLALSLGLSLEPLPSLSAMAPGASPPPPARPSRHGSVPAAAALPRALSDSGYAQKVGRLRDLLVKVSALAAEQIAADAPVEINGLQMVLARGEEKLNVGPGSLRVRQDSGMLAIDFTPGATDVRAASDPSGLSLHATIPRQNGEIAVSIRGGPVTLASLGVKEQDFGLLDVEQARIEAQGNVRLSADAGRVSFDGDGRVSSLSLLHRALADEPVRGIDLAWRAAGALQVDGSLLQLDEGKVEWGAIRLEASGSVERGDDFLRINARAAVPASECKRMFDSLPLALVPKLAGMKLGGTFGMHAGLSLDTRRLEDMKVEWDLKNRCRVTKAPAEIDVDRFTRPFKRTAYDEHGEKVEVVSGPGTEDWVPLQAISPFMEAAVTTTEDGGFRRHGGFDKAAIQNSIRDNLRTQKFMRGASTISMQLAKNLYLEREKNLSRKLQEAILTTYLEQALTKDEILELYFNIVEFGPMIYGIGPAASYYFGTTPYDLSLAQALFLSSILPNPKRTYFTQTGLVSKGWLGYLHRLMKIMRERNKINDEEFVDGLSEVLTYQVARSPRVRPSPEMKRELGGDLPWLAPDSP